MASVASARSLNAVALKAMAPHAVRRTRTGLAALTAIGLAALATAAAAAPAAIETPAREAILIDTTTSSVLMAKNADAPMAPASMSKMMTVDMVFERIKEGRLSLDDTFTVSENAWRKGGAKSGSSTMFLDPGARVRVDDLLHGIIVQSGNDASIVVAEGLSGSEEAFAVEMTRRGRELGLKATTFKNATGWPEPGHVSTVRDLARLAARTINDFPEFYRYYAVKSFTYNGIRQGNRNPLLYKDLGVDGLKTGHIQESGYGLVASAKRGERRLILVVAGLASMSDRSRESERLLEWGFREFDNYALFKAGEKVADAEVWLGVTPMVPLKVKDDVVITLTRKARRDMKVTLAYEGPIPAPVEAGSHIATVRIVAPDTDTVEIPLAAGESVAELGLFGRLKAALTHVLWGRSG